MIKCPVHNDGKIVLAKHLVQLFSTMILQYSIYT